MFRALLLEKIEDRFNASVKEIGKERLLNQKGEVLVKVEYSTLNYKDALAITNHASIVREWPMVAGIDFVGKVIEDKSGTYKEGDKVILNGYGASERFWGGLAEYAFVEAKYLIPLPDQLTTWDAMALGTAGYTAALSVEALLEHGITEDGGKILVSGASGGVGLTAIMLLVKMGFEVVALTAKTQETKFFKRLGVKKVINAKNYYEKGEVLGEEKWQAAIDVVGSYTLTNICSEMEYGGAVAACGLAQGIDFLGTVAPFILRGVTLYGIDSVMANREKRLKAWELLNNEIDTEFYNTFCDTISLEECKEIAKEMVAGNIKGRFVVDVDQ